MDMLEEKYIDLLLKRCINFKKSSSLFISYKMDNRDFVNKLVDKAYKMGVDDIYLEEENIYVKHDTLKNINVDDIDTHEYFNKGVWDKYALKNSSFLIFESEYPGVMNDISPDKLSRARYVERITRPIYKKLQLEFKVPWCISVLPNKVWAKSLFNELDEKQAYDKLFMLICDMCMINTDSPIESWDQLLLTQRMLEDKLNSLEISNMHYKNSLGTDLFVKLTPNTIWKSAGSLAKDMLPNLPTYEIFSNLNFRATNGIVYSSRPLCYNGGIISNFYLEFKDGKIVNYYAKEGYELLKGIINSDKYSGYLGEIALVDNNSPISNTGIIYGNTMFDENASCHFALGSGFSECIKDGEFMSLDKLVEYGVNTSRNHVDFMVGTSDLMVDAETKKGKMLIFKNGSFNI